MAIKLYLIRHGENLSAYDGRYYGQTDLALSEQGRGQMAFLAKRLGGIPPSAIYCSDLARSRESAQVLGRKWGLSPIVWPELREINMGRWEGMSYEEINQLFPKQSEEWAKGSLDFRFPKGESLNDLKARVLPAHRRLIAENSEDAVLAIVGHAGPSRLILCRALGISLTHFWRLGQDFGGLSIIDYHGASALVSLLNFREEILGK
ncbi:MAG: alpha-ribazole phosphatase [bacterium]